MKKHNLFIVLFSTFVYLEFTLTVILNNSYTIIKIIAPAILSVFIFFLIKPFNNKIQKTLFYIFISLFTFLFMVQLCMYRMYGFYFDFGLLAAADQIGAFYKDLIKLISANAGGLFLLELPIIACIFYDSKIDYSPSHKGLIILNIPLAILLIFIFFYTPSNISTDVSVIKNGVITSFVSNFKEKEKVDLVTDSFSELAIVVPHEEIDNHILDIDFENTISNNSNIQKLNNYFSNSSSTGNNDLTGIFKDKNLVLILAESFNEIGVREDITPTLYKMMNDGFVFNNYYSTSYNSTIGGEFQLLTGMYAMSGSIETWKSGTNYFPMGPGNLFKENGYSIHAYHDHDYKYMNRNLYEASVGFDNFIGCGNGLEKNMECYIRFESDEDLARYTIDDYKNEDKFFTYYITVSGHGPYTFDTNENKIGSLHQQELYKKNYAYSDKSIAYLSSMIELENMLKMISDELIKTNKYDDTVFVIVADHYPYYLETPEIKELSGEEKDEVIGVCENKLIIYNNQTKQVVCDKVGNTMDVIATIYNLFDIPFDSRLIPGKDLFSDAPGFALFGNGSWVSDLGIYYAHKGSFVPKENIEIEEDYFDKANAYAQSQMSLTNLIVLNDYYKYIWDYKK